MRKVNPVKHEEKRREILIAAQRCFARDGFQGASTSEICKEAKISPGHLYHYFASKEDIIKAIAKMRLDIATERYVRMLEGTDAITALLSEVDTSNLAHGRANSNLFFAMMEEAGCNPAVAKIMRENSRKIQEMLADYLRKGQASGQIDRCLDAESTATLLMCVFDGMKTLTIHDPKMNMDKAIGVLKILITRFLAPSPKTR
ncbi:MAG TPA: TetR/AcrR family transcriptional regulator [Rhizomicrobium sp.]|jgi:AcrR family transcriptional regulator